ncbi:MAG: hypothetical protein JHD28_07280, partial [Bacteroidia bacterium]|nr:hypothetical protein [Bacteroidia bacterium]
MIKLILGSLLSTFGLLTLVFFVEYNGTAIQNPWLFQLIGFLVLVVGIALFYWTYRTLILQNEQNIETQISNIKRNGNKVQVDLLKCEIIQNSYLEEKDNNNIGNYSNIKFWDALNDPNSKDEYLPVNQMRLIYTVSKNDEVESYVSQLIYCNRETLLMKLYRQKETLLYIDKDDS